MSAIIFKAIDLEKQKIYTGKWKQLTKTSIKGISGIPMEWLIQEKCRLKAAGIKCRIKNNILWRIEPDYILYGNSIKIYI
ncbi:MAG: hypothetical protein KKG99_06315 [Bacteroidetes bacterium]|nr:hypothetical protein [Bacteroidota bacterium]